MNKREFLEKYRAQLICDWKWASDEKRLDNYMKSVEGTICNGHNTWTADGTSLVAAWQNGGMKGKPTLKALRMLPA